MSRRIDIELTSKKNDDEWTWRAAGAKQPKGVLATSVLYDGAKVGDVVRAEADFEIDGIFITSVSPPQGKRQEDPSKRLVITGPSKKFEPVTSQLADKRERSDRRPRPGRKDDKDRKDHNRERKGSRSTEAPHGRQGRPERDRRSRPERPRATPTFKKLAPQDTHRKAVLEEVAPEHRPIAEKVLRGGIPAVRQAIDAENEKARTEGRAEVNAAALLLLAEDLLPKLKSAEWLDRAEAAKASVDDISVRDLRAVVGAADAAARTDEARLLASELRSALDRRSEEARAAWVKDITTSLEEKRVVRALRLSSRPPDAQIKFPSDLLEQLNAAASEAMAPDAPADRWIALLDAVGGSPVRRTVEPAGLPSEPSEEVLTAAKQAAGRIPALAKQLGVKIPPPPRRPPPPPGTAPSASS